MKINRNFKSNLIYPLILLALILVMVSSLGCLSDDDDDNPEAQVLSTTTPTTPTASLSTTPQQTTQISEPLVLFDEDVVTSLYERTIPAVMTVHTVIDNGEGSLFQPTQTGQGSGFLIDEEGHILTNYHVIENASEVQVTLNDGRTIDAEISGTYREEDLALLKIDPIKVSGSLPLPLGDSDTAKPGQMAIALGAPFGLEGTITVGIVSGKGRSITGIANRTITDVIQTDAAINYGNSGGPLLNSSGEVIGINTAIEVSRSQASGIGYAVPINTAKSVLESLIEGEEIHRPWLGIEGTRITPELIERLDLPVEEGAYVIAVSPGSPAEESGIRGSGTDRYGQATFGGDIITAVDGEKIAGVEDLVKYFNTKKPYDLVTLSVTREAEEISVEVTLAQWPEVLPSAENEMSPFQDDFFDQFEWRFPDDQ